MVKLFGFGQLSIHLIYIGLAAIFWAITAYIGLNLYTRDSTPERETIKQHPFIFSFMKLLGITFSGIIYAISSLCNYKKTVKKDNLDLNKLANPHGMFIIKQKNNNKAIVHLCMLMLGTLELFQAAGAAIFNNNISNMACAFMFFNLIVIQTFIVILLSHIFLKYLYYRHQLFSVLLLIIGTVITLIEILIYLDMTVETLFSILAFLVIYVMGAIKDVMEKWLMEIQNINPYKLLFYEGIYGLGVNILLFIPLEFIECKSTWRFCVNELKITELNPPYYIEKVFRGFRVLFSTTKVGVLLFVYALFTTFHYVFALLVNEYYTPIHKSIAEILSSLINWIMQIQYIPDSTAASKMLSVVGYLILLIGSLIFNEIIICYFWGFEVNTKKEIRNRSEKDVKELTDNSLIEITDLDGNL